MYYAVYIYDHQRDIRRILYFRMRIYFLYKKDFKFAIEKLIKEKFEIKNQINELIKDEDFVKDIKDLLKNRLI